jgi:formate hydrogenlyase subunit 3/multisubunit Na+/H+ antiporter MnhD subunit
MALGGALCLAAGVRALASGERAELTLLSRASFRLDPLAGAFLLPVGLVPALGAIFGAGYWSEVEHGHAARRLRVFLGLLSGAMAAVVLAKDALVLLYAWEIMALATFFVVTAHDEEPEVRRAGWVYFVATHVGTLALFALFALLRARTGGFELARLPAAALTPRTTAAVLVLAAVGFGLKAGVVPLHVWLPGAHANAPSHVSAVLSGVLLKIGIYGMVRMLWMMPSVPRWWAGALLGLGAVTCLFGISLAAAQRDYKRLLAYSSIENIGVIVLALALLSLGIADGDPALAALGLAAAILHVWNHSLFKSLMFLAAGCLLHATGTRRMGALGGLARGMPRVAALSAVGCVAICALPPLNGFASELLLYSGLLRGIAERGPGTGGALAAAAVVLAMTGALALVAFVKLFAGVFLGEARSRATEGASDPPALMLAPMIALAALGLAIGALPAPAVGLAARAAGGWREAGAAAGAALLPGLAGIGLFGAGALVLAALGALWLQGRARTARRERPGTWDCGYAAPSERMQYGESSLARTLVGLFAWVIVPRQGTLRVEGPFPAPARHATEAPDVVLDRGVVPALRAAARGALGLRFLQQGRVQVYVLYILLVVVALLLVR